MVQAAQESGQEIAPGIRLFVVHAPEDAWFKSSYSDENAANCVEIADLDTRVGIRDSKDVSLPALIVSPEAFPATQG